ncbi:CpaE family protein [Castellaniella sp.]|uniref:AAA family ATPase n=1 Tax=Castellaniella sp. TaxID=1955812 RepID=UPI003561269C
MNDSPGPDMTTLPHLGNTAVLGSALFLHASDERTHGAWLSSALSGHGLLRSAPLAEEAVGDLVGVSMPQAIFIDFTGEQGARSGLLAAALRRKWPDLVLIAVGHASQTQVTLAALRAGVDDFVDLDSPAENVMPIVRERLAQRESTRAPTRRGRTLALLGARAGLGVSTLACNLAACLQPARAEPARRRGAKTLSATTAGPQRLGTGLLDLGLPARDDLLYLGLQSSFSFVDGVQNLHRLDQTLLQTALPQHANGTAVLPLPANLGQIREISHSQSVNFVRRLTDFFDLQIIDLGGFTTPDFLAQIITAADQVWVVCDQSIGAIVSTSNLLRELREREVDTATLSLVVNRFEPGVDLPAQDIARQLDLPLAHVLPARRQSLLAAATRGKLVVQDAPGDAWSQAVTDMARELLPWINGGELGRPTADAASTPTWVSRWLRPWKTQG